jgi:8-oxo-dGTP diphosphatase
MFLYTAKSETRQVSACYEGELRWIPKDEIMSLPMWEGDRIFLEKLMAGEDDIMLKLVYEGDKLVSSSSN